MEEISKEDYALMRDKALSQLRGVSLTGKDSTFAPLLKEFLESALDAEMSAHLDAEERFKGNNPNDRGRKTIKQWLETLKFPLLRIA